MIDTVKLYAREFSLAGDHRLQWNVRMGAGGSVVSEDRKKKVDLGSGWYATVDEGNQSGKILYLDGSLPRLLYGTSLDECKESDYDRAVSVLGDRLRHAGVLLPSDSFESGLQLSRVDWCRNLKVSHPIPSYLAAFSQYNLPRQDKATWNTETLLWFNSRRELTMYDKISDVIAKEQDTQILSRAQKMPHDKFRVEYRVKRGSEVRKTIGAVDRVRLQDVFDKTLSRRLLLSQVGKLVKREDDREVEGFANLVEMIAQARGRVLTVVKAVGARSIMEQMGYDGDRLLSVLLSCGVPRTTAYRYRSQLVSLCAGYVPVVDAVLIQEVREKLAA